ncbi:MAG: GxxExxY protein [Planctomycetota bacterium]
MLHEEGLTEKIIGAAIEVHRHLGPGLLESAYETCLCHELNLRELKFHRQQAVPLEYKGIQLECGYRIDVVVEEKVVVELKCVDAVLPIHLAQLLTYLRLTRCRVGLLLNFQVEAMRTGIHRRVL